MTRLYRALPFFSLLVSLTSQTTSQLLFSQKLDHFDPLNNKTWQQVYNINDGFFNNKTRDGPVFLMIGGRSFDVAASFNEGIWIDWANKYSALWISVEHRYYGDSYPTPDASTENLKYLSSRQALADLANFISTQKTALNLTKNKWIVFGGGYSGSLAAWFRLKYPHLAYGAVASSAPLLAKINFKEYYEGVNNALKTSKQGSKCTDAIQQSFSALVKLTQSKATCGNVTKLFQLCTPLNCSDGLQVSFFFQILASGIFGKILKLYNSPYTPFPNIDATCDIMTNSSLGAPLDRLVALNDIFVPWTGRNCIFADYYGFIQYSQSTNWKSSALYTGDRQWFYQMCTEFGFLQTSDSTNQPFGNLFPLNIVNREQCTDIFGPNFNSQLISSAVNWTNVEYGGLDLVLNRTIFVSGSLDPWSSLGMTKKTGNLAIVINGTSYGADMYSKSSNDSPALIAAKLYIESILKSWIQTH